MTILFNISDLLYASLLSLRINKTRHGQSFKHPVCLEACTAPCLVADHVNLRFYFHLLFPS